VLSRIKEIPMAKTHTTLIALLLGLAVTLGLVAALRTTALAPDSSAASAASITARQQRLDRAEAQLRRALARRPPALPAAVGPAPTAAPRITYVRPAPIVVTKSAHGEHEHEHENESEAFDD
jgi:hypothetical protein